jgi:hypothetical protein
MRRKAPKLACDIGNVIEIHQGQDQRIEYSEHLGDGGNTNAAPIFSQRHITASVESIFHGPMVADQAKEPLGRTPFAGQARLAIDDFNTAFLWRFAFALQTEDLPNFSPIPAKILVEIGTRDEVTPTRLSWRGLHHPQ